MVEQHSINNHKCIIWEANTVGGHQVNLVWTTQVDVKSFKKKKNDRVRPFTALIQLQWEFVNLMKLFSLSARTSSSLWHFQRALAHPHIASVKALSSPSCHLVHLTFDSFHFKFYLYISPCSPVTTAQSRQNECHIMLRLLLLHAVTTVIKPERLQVYNIF